LFCLGNRSSRLQRTLFSFEIAAFKPRDITSPVKHTHSVAQRVEKGEEHGNRPPILGLAEPSQLCLQKIPKNWRVAVEIGFVDFSAGPAMSIAI
jgi:hypothetical protein